MSQKTWLRVLDSLAKLKICAKQDNNEEEGDCAYFFVLEDAIVIDETDLNTIAKSLEAAVSIITNDKGDAEANDSLCIYFKPKEA